MSTLITVVEGVATAALKFFFEDKEPTLELKPLFEKNLNNNVFELLCSEFKGTDFDTYRESGRVRLATRKGKRVFCSFEVLDKAHPFRQLWSESKANWDELHRSNMSLLWQLTNKFKTVRDYSSNNFILSSKIVAALADTNCGRLVHFKFTEYNGLKRFFAIFAGIGKDSNDLTSVWFSSDDVNWDISDCITTPANNKKYLTFPYYDRHGRFMSIVKYRVGNPEQFIFKATVEYLNDTVVFTKTEIKNQTDIFIPKVLSDKISLAKIMGIEKQICSVTGVKVDFYNVVTNDGKDAIITVCY